MNQSQLSLRFKTCRRRTSNLGVSPIDTPLSASPLHPSVLPDSVPCLRIPSADPRYIRRISGIYRLFCQHRCIYIYKPPPPFPRGWRSRSRGDFSQTAFPNVDKIGRWLRVGRGRGGDACETRGLKKGWFFGIGRFERELLCGSAWILERFSNRAVFSCEISRISLLAVFFSGLNFWRSKRSIRKGIE